MREKNVRHIDPIHAHVYGFSTCEKERFCEGVLWGKFTQVSCSSNSTTACSTQQHMNLGAWPLKYGREGMGIFWHADFSELLNENTAYLGKSLQKKFCRLTFFFFFKECQLRYCEFNFKRQHLLARKSEAITNDDTLTQWFSGTLQSRFSEISELIRITKTLTSQCQGWGNRREPWPRSSSLEPLGWPTDREQGLV